ncbi:proton-coupled zinc antiporter SLC30A1-like [Tachypleus tridentatus]|uniref:proton-coupled zinc antiporter SLC30A1-like n=1 Tax=Tachypleus tridentatus TaxID=6853 RepID=UPI003FD648A6
MKTHKVVKLYIMIGLTGLFFGAEIVASHFTKSLVLLVDSYHTLYNVLSLLLLIISYRMTKERTLKNTFGWARVEVLGVLVNMLFLVALCFSVCVESLQTIFHASHENTQPRFPYGLLTFGLIGLFLNCICTILIGGYTQHQGCYLSVHGDDVQVNLVLGTDEHASEPRQVEPVGHTSESLPYVQSCGSDSNEVKQYSRNLRRVLDFLRDSCSCVLVTVVAYFVLYLDGRGVTEYADPLLGLTTVVVLIATSYPLMKESGLILLQSVPHHIDVRELKKRLMLKFPAILNVHDLHVWRLTSDHAIATIHIILNSPNDYLDIAYHMEKFLQRQGIAFVTVQPEFFKSNGFLQSSECILQCSKSKTCGALTCCGPLRHTFTKQLETRHSKMSQSLSVDDPVSISSNVASILPVVHKKNNMQRACNRLETHEESTTLASNFEKDNNACCEGFGGYHFKNLGEVKETRV